MDKGHYCNPNRDTPTIKDGNAGYTYTQCKETYNSGWCGGPIDYHTGSNYVENNVTYTPYSGWTCRTCGATGGAGRYIAETASQHQQHETHSWGVKEGNHSSAHTYTCPCTNGQLIGIVINYTVNGTAGSVILTQ